VLICCGISSSAALPAPAAHCSSEEILEDRLKIIHICLLSPATVKTAESSTHIAENVLIFKALEGVLLGGASLIIIFAFALVREGLVSAKVVGEVLVDFCEAILGIRTTILIRM
jgi:hypothetical protein